MARLEELIEVVTPFVLKSAKKIASSQKRAASFIGREEDIEFLRWWFTHDHIIEHGLETMKLRSIFDDTFPLDVSADALVAYKILSGELLIKGEYPKAPIDIAYFSRTGKDDAILSKLKKRIQGREWNRSTAYHLSYSIEGLLMDVDKYPALNRLDDAKIRAFLLKGKISEAIDKIIGHARDMYELNNYSWRKSTDTFKDKELEGSKSRKFVEWFLAEDPLFYEAIASSKFRADRKPLSALAQALVVFYMLSGYVKVNEKYITSRDDLELLAYDRGIGSYIDRISGILQSRHYNKDFPPSLKFSLSSLVHKVSQYAPLSKKFRGPVDFEAIEARAFSLEPDYDDPALDIEEELSGKVARAKVEKMNSKDIVAIVEDALAKGSVENNYDLHISNFDGKRIKMELQTEYREPSVTIRDGIQLHIRQLTSLLPADYQHLIQLNVMAYASSTSTKKFGISCTAAKPSAEDATLSFLKGYQHLLGQAKSF